jgi:thiamine pyrophosphokinase
MNVLICANGTNLPATQLEKLVNEADFVIAADGGANKCLQNHIIPDLIIGDFDSITPATKEFFQNVKQIHLQEQETTDLEKALAYAKKLKAAHISICSLFGERLDHTFANTIIMQKFAEQNSISLTLYDNSGTIKIWKPGIYKVKAERGKSVSFFSFSKIKKLTLKGFRYELFEKDFLENFIGISNEFLKSECFISFSEGILFQYENA